MQLAVERDDLVKEANKSGFYTTLFDLEDPQCTGELGSDRGPALRLREKKSGCYHSGCRWPFSVNQRKCLRQQWQVHSLTNEVQHAWFLKYRPGGSVRVNLPVQVRTTKGGADS